MKLGSIHHIAIICSDRETALDFYHNKLGFQVVRENYRPENEEVVLMMPMGYAAEDAKPMEKWHNHAKPIEETVIYL